MPRVALIAYEQYPPPALLAMPGLAAEISDVDVYALPGTDLEPFDALFIGTGADQRLLADERERLEAFLDAGHAIVFCGHVAYPFLDGLAEFVPLARRRLEDLAVARVQAHPVFDGIVLADLTFRKGVAGFYGRGHNPPPPGAVILHGIGAALAPVDWVWQRDRGGVLLVHAGNDLWGYGADAGSAAVLPRQLVRWAAERRRAEVSS